MPAMVSGYPEVSVHFSRLRVRRTGLDDDALDQFSIDKFLPAAELLTDAAVDVIAWAGCAGSWMGPAYEAELCGELARRTGVPVFTSTQAIHNALVALDVSRYSLAAPYPQDMVNKIIDVYAQAGFTCVHAAQLSLFSTLDKDRVPRSEIEALIRAAAQDHKEPVVVPCTNFRAATVVGQLERDLGLIIIDSIAVTMWQALRTLGVELAGQGWGHLLSGNQR